MEKDNQSLYLNLYFKFQQEFKPIKRYNNMKDIIVEAMKALSKVLQLSPHSESDFVKGIKLVYPNYFTETHNKRYEPIADELILFNNTKESLEKSVIQHMSYYMAHAVKTNSKKRFIRISRSLIQNDQTSLSSFYVTKKERKGFSISVYVEDKWLPDAQIPKPYDFPIDIKQCRLKNFNGHFVPYQGLSNIYSLSVKDNNLVTVQDGLVKESHFDNSSAFAKTFCKPLSAHFVMLKEASLLYVYSQTAQIGKSNNLGYGGMFALLPVSLNEQSREQYRSFFQLVSDYISICIAHNIMWEKQSSESIKSAVSAIMSRNMSHNLGSHYLFYTKAQLEKLANKEDSIAPDIRGVAKVLSYIQTRMDYLATIISNDKYPYGAVNFKSQIYDELTVDDFSHRHFPDDCNKRTTNFLLRNIVLSENLTRQDVRSDKRIEEHKDKLFINVKYSEDGINYNHFTGSWNLEEEKKELAVKQTLSSLNLALPGGSMSCHAFFNIVENFIRNSAKYRRNEIKTEEGLIISIAIRPNPTNNLLKDIIIYDNKENANAVDKNSKKHSTLFSQLEDKLKFLEIIDESNQLSKKNKGFKEMLFSSVWMNAYKFKDKTYAEIISNINHEKDPKKKISLIEYYGFSLVKVKEILKDETSEIRIFTSKEKVDGDANLGVLITLPLYNTCKKLELGNNTIQNINAMLNVMADVIEVDNSFTKKTNKFRHAFTRIITLNDSQTQISELAKYKLAVKKRFKDIDKYALCFSDIGSPAIKDNLYRIYDNELDMNCNDSNSKYKIYFYRHLQTNKDANNFSKLAYADTISGANFTISLASLFRDGIDERGFFKSDDDQLLALKIKESALTRITIIDERLFNSTYSSEDDNLSPWLALKNIRLLNYDDEFDDKVAQKSSDLSSVFKGNEFRDKSNGTHFLTIHLGLIEKILKNSRYVNSLIDIKLKNDSKSFSSNPLATRRVEAFMALLKNTFSFRYRAYPLHIAIHSGRGNYSDELEGPLSGYPFITLSALESAFNNSKYQLSQLLYNTVYIGKGIANKR